MKYSFRLNLGFFSKPGKPLISKVVLLKAKLLQIASIRPLKCEVFCSKDTTRGPCLLRQGATRAVTIWGAREAFFLFQSQDREQRVRNFQSRTARSKW